VYVIVGCWTLEYDGIAVAGAIVVIGRDPSIGAPNVPDAIGRPNVPEASMAIWVLDVQKLKAGQCFVWEPNFGLNLSGS
jgi:hypothetical protein